MTANSIFLYVNNLQYVDMEVVEKKRFRVSRWIFLSLAIIFNCLIIAYYCFLKMPLIN